MAEKQAEIDVEMADVEMADETTTESVNSEFASRVRSVVYGNAIGDAIGLLTEFMSKKDASTYYGAQKELEFEMKVPDMHRTRWQTGDWTDDTDQLILIMQSLLDKGEISPVDFAMKLNRWRMRGFRELGDFAGMGIGATTMKVLSHEKFQTDPHAASRDIWERTGRVIAPNGGVMRTAILGVYQYHDIDKVIENTLNICKVTHADPRCQASCVAVTTAIAFMLQKNSRHCKKNGELDIDAIIKESYQLAKKHLTEKSHEKELKDYMFPKSGLFDNSLSSLKLAEEKAIGYTYKCMGSGFWALRQNDFRTALQKLIMEGGDADTNGAVAGALLGCKLGVEGFPSSWLNGLKHKEWLDKIIDKFVLLCEKDS